MQPVGGNLTVGAEHLLYKCMEFITTLTTVNGSYPQVIFKTNKGTEFVKVEGFRHYPILLNEGLYKFTTGLGTTAAVILFVILTCTCLSFCNHLIKLSLVSCRDRADRRERAARFRASCNHSRPIVLATLPTSASAVNSPPPPPPYRQSVQLGDAESGTVAKRYLKEPVITIDRKFVVQAFERFGNSHETGIHLQIQPANRCPRINCERIGCPNQHIFFISIPCSHTFHPQLEITYPPRNFHVTTPPEQETTVSG